MVSTPLQSLGDQPEPLALYKFARLYQNLREIDHGELGNSRRFSLEDEKILQALSEIHLTGPSSWGAAFWAPIHLWSILKVPMFPTEKERDELTEMLQRFWPEMIPCSECAAHFKANAASIYQDTETGLKLFKRLVSMHNWVNIHKKKIPPKPFVDVAVLFQHPERVCDGIKAALVVNATCPQPRLGDFRDSQPPASASMQCMGSVLALVVIVFVAPLLVYIIRLRRELQLLSVRRKLDRR